MQARVDGVPIIFGTQVIKTKRPVWPRASRLSLPDYVSYDYWSTKRLIQDKQDAYKGFKRSNNNSQNYANFQFIQNFIGVPNEASKQRSYFRLSKKLMDSSASPKTYSSVVKSFYNNNKIPCTHKNRFVTSFKEKSKLFSFFFASNIQL